MNVILRLLCLVFVFFSAFFAIAGETQLTEAFAWSLPEWSPDGRLIAATVRDESRFNQVYLVDVKTQLILWRTKSARNHFRARFSPDGEWIAYHAFDEETNLDQLFAIHVSGGEEIRVTGSDWNHSTPVWSPDSSTFGCTLWKTDSMTQIAIVDRASGAEEILAGGFLNRWFPEWSPDGSILTFFGEDPEGFPFPHIFVMDLASRISIRLTSGTAYRAKPRWFPDGERIVYEKAIGPHRQVMMISRNGGEEIQLTNNPREHWDPVVSPDGAWIAYSSFPFGGDGIYIFPDRVFMRSVGSGTEISLTTTQVEYDRISPVWSPDGSMLAYTKKAADPLLRENPQIHIVPTGIGCRTGNANGATLIEERILSVNGSYGERDNSVRVIAGSAVVIRMEAPPLGPEPGGFVLYGSKGTSAPAENARGIGVTCFPTPLSNGSPITITNSLGHRRYLGRRPRYEIGFTPAEFTLEGVLPGKWHIQGFIRDWGSRSTYNISVTNAVTLQVL